MTNEQTQAERLAKKFLDTHATMTSPEYSGTARYESNRIQVNWLTDLITQATAELRAENERLKEALKLCATHDPLKDMVGDGSTHCGFIANKAKEALQNTQNYSVLRTENERLKKELAESNQLCQRLIHTSELEREAIWQYRLKVSSDPSLPHLDFGNWSNLEWIQEQIQAWARTRESLESTKTEAERLKAKLDACETAGFDINDPHSHGRAISKDRDAYIKRVTELESERDQAQAQVAALVEAITKTGKGQMISRHLEDEINGEIPDPEDIWQNYVSTLCLNALDDTQATADAYTAKVRREAIEDVIRNIESARTPDSNADQLWTKEFQRGRDYGIGRAIGVAQRLLPEPAEADEKGGEA